MSIDWASTGTMMQGWAGFAQAGAIAFAAWKASDSFKSWRSQKIEDRRITEAERILTVVYRLRRAFSIIRSRIMSGHALAAAEETLKQHGAEFEKLDERRRKGMTYTQAIYDRITCYSKEWEEIAAVIPVAAAHFGKETERQLEGLWLQVVVVKAAAESYGEDNFQDADFTKQIRAELWERPNHPDDAVGSKITELVNQLEATLLPVIRSNIERSG